MRRGISFTERCVVHVERGSRLFPMSKGGSCKKSANFGEVFTTMKEIVLFEIHCVSNVSKLFHILLATLLSSFCPCFINRKARRRRNQLQPTPTTMVSFDIELPNADQNTMLTSLPMHFLTTPHLQHHTPQLATNAHLACVSQGLRHTLVAPPPSASAPTGSRCKFGVHYVSRSLNGRTESAALDLKVKNYRTDIEMRTQLFHSAMRSKMKIQAINCEHWRGTFATRSTHEIFMHALLAEAFEYHVGPKGILRTNRTTADPMTASPSLSSLSITSENSLLQDDGGEVCMNSEPTSETPSQDPDVINDDSVTPSSSEHGSGPTPLVPFPQCGDIFAVTNHDFVLFRRKFKNYLRQIHKVVRAIMRGSSTTSDKYPKAVSFISSRRIFDRNLDISSW